MIKVYTSYFYQLRFFKPYMIPLSTAMWDPAWYNQNRGQGYVFKDKNGVYNGLRADPFMPGPQCSGDCRGRENCNTRDFNSCAFLRNYRKQLDNLDFEDIMKRINRICSYIQEQEGFLEEPIAILLVHEAPNNPCSERRVIQEWFADHDVQVSEWNKSI